MTEPAQLTVYVAAAGRELDRARWAIAAVRERGLIVIHDWTPDIERALLEGREERDYPDAQREQWANADLLAVERADILWLLAPVEGGRGAWVEYGFALDRTRTIVSGPNARGSIFTSLATYLCDTDDEALAVILAVARDEAES